MYIYILYACICTYISLFSCYFYVLYVFLQPLNTHLEHSIT